MKKFLIIFTILATSTLLKAQDGSSCSSAINVGNEAIPVMQIQTIQSQWYQFVAMSGHVKIIVSEFTGATNVKLSHAELYGGTCTALTLIANDSTTSINDSVSVLETAGLLPGSVYFIKVVKNAGSMDQAKYAFDVKYELETECVGCHDPVLNNCNLVCNGDFEYSGGLYPSTWSQISLACPWKMASAGTSDYFHVLSTDPDLGIPSNYFGNRPARSGDAYAGFAAYVIGAIVPDYHEYIYQPLRCQLMPGVTYELTFYVNLGYSSEYSVSSIGACFLPSSAGLPFSGYGQFPIPTGATTVMNTTGFVSDKSGWTAITGTFTAQGNEAVIMIGDFGSTNSANVHEELPVPVPPLPEVDYMSYYYIDDISLTPVNTMTISADDYLVCPNSYVYFTNSLNANIDWTVSGTSGLDCYSNCDIVSGVFNSSATVGGVITYCDGCSYTATVDIAVVSSTVNAGPDVSICQEGSGVDLTATGGGPYQWSTGETTATIHVNPSTTTTTTYTVTTPDTEGCGFTATDQVTVTVNVGPIVSVNSPSICEGDHALLTATGTAGASFNWSTGSTSNSIVVSPTATTTYTVTGTLANGCSATAVATVTVTPIPVVTVNSPTICSGQPANLTANGATSYSWSAGLTSTGVNTATATPGSTTTYTVTGNTAGCLGTAIATVTVNPSPVVTVSSSSICFGQSANLTAAGATSYTWSPGATPTSVNTASVTPTITSTYTVTGTTGSCSGTAVSTITVTTISPPTIVVSSDPICLGTSATLTVTAPAGATYDWYTSASGGSPFYTGATYVTPSLGSNTTYYVSSAASGCTSALIPVTVNVVACCTPSSPSKVLSPSYSSGSTTIAGSGVWVAAGLVTNVANGATLILDGISLIMSPNYKIIVAPGGKLIVRNGTKIWACTGYMWEGIEVQANSSIGGRVEINSDVRIEDAKIAVHVINASVQAEFDLHNVVLNKNYIGLLVEPYAGTHSGAVYATRFYSENTPSVLSPNIASAFTSPYLKMPYAASPGQKAYEGIEINNVKSIQIGMAGTSANQNIFSNLNLGIQSHNNTGLTCVNNSFKDIQFRPFVSFTGIGIYSHNGGSLFVGGLVSNTANAFKDCYYGIRINNNVSLDCQMNSFTSIGNNPSSPGRCIYITNVSALGYKIRNNAFKDFITGVEINSYNKCFVEIGTNDFKKFELGTAIYSLQNIGSDFNVLSNTFNNGVADYGNTAIRVQNAVLSVNGRVIIKSNDIRNCKIGIKNTRINKLIVDDLNMVKFSLSSPPALPGNFGIWNENCPSGYINNNQVTKTGTTAGSAFNNLLYGYSFQNGCSNSTITDNVVTNMNTGFQFAGLNNLLPDGFGCNMINYNYTGLELNNTSIGNQGVAGSAAEDNQWQLPSATIYPLTFGIKRVSVSGVTPVFNTRSLASPWTVAPGNQNPSFPPAVNFVVSAAGTPYGCIHGCLSPPCSHAPVVVRIAKKMAPYDLLSDSDIAITYTNTYSDIKSDSTLYNTGTPDDAVVINFRDSLALTTIGKFYDVGEKIVQGDLINATSINDGIAPRDCMEQNQQIVNKIYASTWALGVFELSPADSAALLTIANYTVEQCGLAVYDARVMLRMDKNDYIVEQNRNMVSMPENHEMAGVMYPNPARTVAYYEIELAAQETGFVELFDLLGNMVASEKLYSDSNRAEIDLSHLSNGLYVYKVIINNEFRVSNKLVIAK